MIDYKELLTKYLHHIIDCESHTYLDDGYLEVTDEEAEELRSIADDWCSL